MKPVKFRGKSLSGVIFHGELRATPTGMCIYNRGMVNVSPRSIRQYLGCDENDEEIYDSDVVCDEFGNELTARLCVMIGEEVFSLGDTFLGYKKNKPETT